MVNEEIAPLRSTYGATFAFICQKNCSPPPPPSSPPPQHPPPHPPLPHNQHLHPQPLHPKHPHPQQGAHLLSEAVARAQQCQRSQVVQLLQGARKPEQRADQINIIYREIIVMKKYIYIVKAKAES